ncbi:MAG: hypothetical protein CL908_11915 [Deltaproteobacteria bacterium]|jgi:transcriptional regulator with PAS, ATPase and Fis domain|nr:hypothetical protein [Deltaproteobacteria bacterium]
MRSIRSLLWVGTGRGLSESGVSEAPELDVTWVPNVAEAVLLPRVQFDGVLLEADKFEVVAEALATVERGIPSTPMIVCLPERESGHGDAVLDLGAAAVFFHDSGRSGPGIVSAIGDTLDELHEIPVPPSEGPHTQPLSSSPAAPATETRAGQAPGALEEASTPQMIACSRSMQEVCELVDLAASSPSTVLLTGETGAGKEVIARQLHARSCREDEPFLAINCAAFPESLLESELFGHTKGAFTGADRAKSGLFEAAGRGTLFLDEIAEMGLPLQAKLLRVLQEREIRPVGGTHQVAVRCRIIAATNRILPEEVQAGHFREDLFYRLNVFPIRIPPLRERRKDVLPLARHFLALHGPREGKPGCHLSLAASHLLEGYRWPGNVRELENEILRTLMLTANGQLITPKVLSPKIVEILEPIAHGAHPGETLREALERVEAWMIRRALANNAGRKARTAQKLGLTREGLYKKIKRLGLD